MSRAPSIMCGERKCYITGDTANLHCHHVFGGCRRKASDEWGCWVWLRADFHNMSNYGVHFNKELDILIKRETQIRFEELHGHDKFMEIFGKNYI